jgi:hypothetical protein
MTKTKKQLTPQLRRWEKMMRTQYLLMQYLRHHGRNQWKQSTPHQSRKAVPSINRLYGRVSLQMNTMVTSSRLDDTLVGSVVVVGLSLLQGSPLKD